MEERPITEKKHLSLYDKIAILCIYNTRLKSCSTNERISISNFLTTPSSERSLNNLRYLELIDEENNLLDKGFKLVKKIKSSYINYKQIALNNDISNVMAMLSASVEALKAKTLGDSPIKIYEGRNLYRLLKDNIRTLEELLGTAVKIDISEEEIDIDSLFK